MDDIVDTPIALSGFKSLGEAGWVGWFSNIFWDRENQRFTLAALKEYADWAMQSPLNLPDLLFWHLPNVVLGKAKEVGVVGPWLVAAGDWGNDSIGQQAQAYFDQTDQDWAMSHGYRYHEQDLVNEEYQRFRTHEVTIIDPDWAANPLTLFKESEDMGFIDRIRNALSDVLAQATPEDIEKMIAEGLNEQETRSKSATADGLHAGVKQETDIKDETETEAEEETSHEEGQALPAEAVEDETVSDDEMALMLTDLLMERDAVSSLTTRLEAAEKQIAALTAQVEQATSRSKALEDQWEQRKKLLPAAITKAFKEGSVQKGDNGDPVSAADVQQDQAKVEKATNENAAPDWGKDAIGAFMHEARIGKGD